MDKKKFEETKKELMPPADLTFVAEPEIEAILSSGVVTDRMRGALSKVKTATEVLLEESTQAYTKSTKELIQKTLKIQSELSDLVCQLRDCLEVLNQPMFLCDTEKNTLKKMNPE